MENAIVILVIVGVLALVMGGIYWARVVEQKRRDQFREVAESLGLDFFEQGAESVMSRFGRFKLFNQGHGRKVLNVVEGDSGDLAISIFDYRYTTGSGKNKSTHHQTIVSLQSPHLNCPDFTIRPENFFDRVGSALGFQDIDFDTHEKFSSMFVLQGSNETRIREFLRPELLEWFEQKPGLALEADQNTMFFYQQRARIKPEQIKDKLAEAYEVYGLLSDQQDVAV